MTAYGEVLRIPAFRTTEALALLTRIPQFGTGVLLTLHVVERLGASYAAAGLAGAVAAVAMAIAGPWRGRRLDRYGLRRTLLPALIIVPLVWLSTPYVGYWPLLAVVAVGGVVNVPISSLVRQITIAAVPPERQRAALALDSVIVEVCFMLGPLLAIMLGTTLGTHIALPTLWIAATAGLAALYVMNPAITAEPYDASSPKTGRWVTLPVVGVYAAVAAAGIVLAGTEVALVAALRALGQPSAIGWAISIWSAGSAIGGLVYGAWRGRHPGVGVLLLALSLMTLPLAWIVSPVRAIPLLILAGLACAPLITATVDALNSAVSAPRRGEALGWHQSALTAGFSIGPPVVGALMDRFGWQAGFLTAGAQGLFVAGFVLMVLRSRPSRR